MPWNPLSADVAGRARVIDGDTIEIAGETVRLQGIDAPELDQTCRRAGREFPCGARAKRWLVDQTHGRDVTCAKQGSDRYDRVLAVCRVGDMILNAEMVLAGWAVASLRYTRLYIEEEIQAAEARAGMWGGEFARPGDWRRGEPRLATAAGPPDHCVIKGNVNSRGEQIFHPPSGRSYERVEVRPWEGDRCFDTAQEARQAGFRQAAQ